MGCCTMPKKPRQTEKPAYRGFFVLYLGENLLLLSDAAILLPLISDTENRTWRGLKYKRQLIH